jgi:hypothetical protein
MKKFLFVVPIGLLVTLIKNINYFSDPNQSNGWIYNFVPFIIYGITLLISKETNFIKWTGVLLILLTILIPVNASGSLFDFFCQPSLRPFVICLPISIIGRTFKPRVILAHISSKTRTSHLLLVYI